MLLCLCFGSSAALFSVNADTLPDNTSSYFQDINITDTENNVVGHVVYSLNVLDSYITNQTYVADLDMIPKTFVPYTTSSGSTIYFVQGTNYGGNYHEGYNSYTSYSYSAIYCTPVNVVCTFSNYSDKYINIPQEIRTTLNITASGSTNFQPDDIGYSADAGNVNSNDIYVNLYNDYVYFDFGNQYRRVDSNSFWLPPHLSCMCSFTIYIYHAYRTTSASSFTPWTFSARNVEVRSTDVTNRTLSDYIPMYNDSYNLYAIANQQQQTNQTIQREQDQTQNAINQQGQATQSAIQSQTEQSEQQYNEFSAGSDSSDSSNINGAISGGTDAVKQKMGLFSFFDGIVNSMSDILTSDHERHLVLPALDVPLPEETVHVWDRKEFDFDELENNFGALLTVVRFATVALCYSVMISGAYNIFHKFIGVKDSDA